MATYIQNYKSIIRLGLPILVGQLGVIIVGFADNVMVGRYATDALASASFVNGLFSCSMFCCMGFTYGVLPLAGALFGSGDDKGERRGIGALMRNATAMNMIFTVALMVVMGILYLLLPHMGQPEYLLPTIRPYFLLALAGLVPVSLFSVFSQWSYAIKNTTMPMWITLLGNALNIAGNYVLIFGKCGMPELGLIGAGISTLFSRAVCAYIIMHVFFRSRKYAEYRQGYHDASIRGREMRRVWITSVPIAMQMAFESGSFSFAAVAAGWLGAIPLAAYQIILIVGTLGFVLYYAIGSALAVLVSNEAGRGSASGMRRAGWAGYHIMLVMATLSCLVFIFGGKTLIGWFTEDEAVLQATMVLIFPLVLYQLGDATQITFANALRGTSRVMPMLWIAFASYIVVGIPATYILAFPVGWGLYGIILSFSVSLFMAGALFLTFFLRATRPTRR